ncbi:MAG: AI-2E family transporter [Clostridia bacterium]|nr:AI-2E family transporter [Clostridia bacterium]
MKNKENEKYFKWGLTALIVIALGILFANKVFFTAGQPGFMSLLLKILRPFVFGGVIAYLVTPLANWLNRRFGGKAYGLANVLALVIAILIVAGIILLIVPRLVSSVIEIAKAAPAQFQTLQDRVTTFLNEYTKGHPEHVEYIEAAIQKVDSWLNGFTQNDLSSTTNLFDSIGPILAGSASKVSSAFGALRDLMIGAIVALYFLSKREQLAAQATMIVRGLFKPSWAEWILNEVKFADRMFNGFFMGKLLDSAIVGVICFVGCLLMGFNNALLIAVIVGVTNIIPFFGPFIGAIPCALLLLLDNPMHALMFLIFVIILQQLDGNVIGPKILGDSTGLSALWVMFGILLFGGLWGILGMLIGVPLMAVIYDIIRQLTYHGLRQKGHQGIIDAYNRKFHPSPQPKQSKKAAH